MMRSLGWGSAGFARSGNVQPVRELFRELLLEDDIVHCCGYPQVFNVVSSSDRLEDILPG